MRIRDALGVALLIVFVSASASAVESGNGLVGLDGGRLTDEDLASGVTILVVWASWSPRCRNIVERIDRIAQAWSERARVASVVFQEEPDAVRAWLSEQRDNADGASQTPVFVDSSGDFSQRHKVTSLPMLLVFRDGQRLFRGKLSASPDAVIERALANDTAG